MSASFTVNYRALDKLTKMVSDPSVHFVFEGIARRKEAAAIVAQAIAENFQKRGPGWPPLRASTILGSVSKANKKRLERAKGKPGYRSKLDAARSPLMGKTRMLFKSVTTPGAPGNIYRVDGTKIVWGTHLVYARIHNRGGVIKNGFGKGVRLRVPKREYLKVSDFWMNELFVFAVKQAERELQDYFRRRA